MTVFRPSPPFLLLLLLLSLILRSSALHSHNCPPPKFTNKKLYSNCTNLRTFHSKLHWSFTPKNSSLSIAFIAPPESPDGWIACAINPTRTGMVGAQALIAFKDSTGSMTVKTYNISSYTSMKEGKIAFEVPESSAEFSGGMMKIFATVKLPEKMTEVNLVWQVGGLVKNGKPMKHEMLTANKMSRARLKLVAKGESNGTTVDDGYDETSSSASTDAGIYGVLTLIGCLLGFF